MIRRQVLQEQLFYRPGDIAKPSKQNFYVRLGELGVDWEKAAKPFEAAFSCGMGRPMDPVVYLKIFLVSYLENIAFDTDLAERIADSIAVRKFLGYDLSEATPDHWSIGRNRGKIAEVCEIEDVLAGVVEQCVAFGLVDGELCAVDATLVPANASLSSLRSVKTGKSVREHLKEVAEKNRLAEESGEGAKEKVKVTNEEFVSETDPDARIAQKEGKPRDMCYMVSHVTDSRSGIILAAGCTHADEGERKAAEPVIEKAKENLSKRGLELKRLAGDAGYDGADFIARVEDMGIEPIINYKPDNHKKADGFKKESFIYDKDRNCYICPKGCLARYHSSDGGRMRYRTDAKECASCPDKAGCIGKDKSRWLSRRYTEESRESNIFRCHTDEGRSALAARKHIVEPPFGHMKTYGGLEMINCRGLKKARLKAVMAAVAYNLIKLVNAWHRKKISAPSPCLSVAAGSAASRQALPAAVCFSHRLVHVWRLPRLTSKPASRRHYPCAA